jgi:acyl carrier protein
MEREEVLGVVKQHLLAVVEDLTEDQIDPVRSMKDLGVNSLDIVEVVSCSMRQLKVKVPRSELAKLSNIDGLVDLLHRSVMEQKQAAANAS